MSDVPGFNGLSFNTNTSSTLSEVPYNVLLHVIYVCLSVYVAFMQGMYTYTLPITSYMYCTK